MCGGTVPGFLPNQVVGGLSPRVRGNQVVPVQPIGIVRSIPACAGEPTDSSTVCCPVAVYPRVCGGTAFFSADSSIAEGLSPRVRGNLYVRPPRQRQVRSIPACAGEPVWINISSSSVAVYPRVCGGTALAFSMVRPWLGLSPRVRGNRSRYEYASGPPRSIPACAGEPIRRGGAAGFA